MTGLVEVLDEHRIPYAVNLLAEFMARSPRRVRPRTLVDYDEDLCIEGAADLRRLGWWTSPLAAPDSLGKWTDPNGKTSHYGKDLTFEFAVWLASGREFEPHLAWVHWEGV